MIFCQRKDILISHLPLLPTGTHPFFALATTMPKWGFLKKKNNLKTDTTGSVTLDSQWSGCREEDPLISAALVTVIVIDRWTSTKTCIALWPLSWDETCILKAEKQHPCVAIKVNCLHQWNVSGSSLLGHQLGQKTDQKPSVHSVGFYWDCRQK